ncbi:MAG: GNAT family protein [Deinococcota bacterium]
MDSLDSLQLVSLQTARLVLRAFQARDVDAVFEYASDPEWQRYLPVPSPYTLEDARAFIDMQLAADPKTMPHWAIIHQGSVIGGIGIGFFEDYNLKVGELGYSLKRSEWGQGFITEAATTVINYAFDTNPNLIRIEASADSRNKASLKVMDKLGMQYEGVLRQRHVVRDELGDEVYYSMLRSEWASQGG